MKNKNSGFTLIELSLVCVVLAVMIAVAMPVFSRGYRDSELRTTAADLAWTMRYGYGAALFEGTRLKLVFDRNEGSYRLEKENDPVRQKGTFIPLESSLLKKKTFPLGIKLSSLSSAELIFNPSGTGDGLRLSLQDAKGKGYELTYSGWNGQVKIDET